MTEPTRSMLLHIALMAGFHAIISVSETPCAMATDSHVSLAAKTYVLQGRGRHSSMPGLRLEQSGSRLLRIRRAPELTDLARAIEVQVSPLEAL